MTSLVSLFCFPIRSCNNTLENYFFQISSYSRAYLRSIYEKTKGQVPLGPPLGKQNIQDVRFWGGGEGGLQMRGSIAITNRLKCLRSPRSTMGKNIW